MTAPEGQAAEVLIAHGLRPRYAVRLATALAPLFAEERRKAWDEGAFAGRTHQQQLQAHAHWSHIGRRLPEPIANPYRERADTYAKGGRDE